MAYKPIENYGLIGDMHTAALVGTDGSIDWMCLPHFDSPSVFAAVLDEHRGGRFTVAPYEIDTTGKQLYWPDTNILVTRFLGREGVAEVRDFMPVHAQGTENERALIRIVHASRGTVPFRMVCAPAFDYARAPHDTLRTARGARFDSAGMRLGLSSTIPVRIEGNAAVTEFVLEEGQSVVFVLRPLRDDETEPRWYPESEANALFQQTVDYWRRWLSRCTYEGRWREMVQRSALALKLMTFEPTGAIVASPTCSLPESIGSIRNWDYRYTWLRDSAFTLYAFLRIGFTDEAMQFMRWLDARYHELEPDGSLQIVYGIDGRHALPEIELSHLEGYRGSRPVRVGNAAYEQVQMDIYGELMDSVYLYNKYATPISFDSWRHLQRTVEWVARHWRDPDEGIWEVRGTRQHFVYSKVMCWVAVDRALRLADKRSFPADRQRWSSVRDEIYEAIMREGWSAERNAFIQAFGSESLDAATLIMPLVFFVSPSDPRMLDTLDAIAAAPRRGGLMSDGLVYRYDAETGVDGMHHPEGTFNMCSFWLVEAMTRAGRLDHRRLDAARLQFEHMLGYANHLGLFAEETGPRGEALGNFPQAFTHLALISAAFNLDRALGRRR